MAQITVLVVGQDNRDSLRLAVESLRRHNGDTPFLLWYWDNDSTDGAREWAEANCDRVFRKPGPIGHHHGVPLDSMVQEVVSPYTVTLDNDVISRGPVLGRMLRHLEHTGAFAVNPACRLPLGEVDHFGRLLIGQPRVDPCCAMFRTPELARLTRRVSFTPAEAANLARFYDTGGLIRHAAEGCGLRVDDADWVWEAIDHVGAMTWAQWSEPGTDIHRDYAARKARVAQALADLDASLAAAGELVLARYREPLDWLARLAGRFPGRVTVYDKSGEAAPGHHPLPNVGREAHTYAHHVAARYHDLAEVTFFAQADPFDHVPDFVDQLAVPTAGFRFLGPHRILTGPGGDSCHAGLAVGEFYRGLTGREFPERTPFAPGACFAAHRDRLRRYPREWWQRLAARLAESDAQGHAPWVMERVWGRLLTDPPVPHIYTAINGWFFPAAAEVYAEAVRAAPDDAHFVEVGAYVGRSTSFMAVEILNSNKRIKFDVVDHFRGSGSAREQFMRDEAAACGGTYRAVFEANVAPVRRGIHAVREAASVEAARLYPDASLDFVFIDGDHEEASVAADVAAWLPKVKPGGLLAGDDYSAAWPGVAAAVDKIFGAARELRGPVWLYRKPH